MKSGLGVCNDVSKDRSRRALPAENLGPLGNEEEFWRGRAVVSGMPGAQHTDSV